MNTHKVPPRAKLVVSLALAFFLILGVAVGGRAQAAPQVVTQHGTAVTTAVPGKPFTIKFRVKNSGDTTYDGVKVTFHLPGDLSVTSIAPNDATVDGNDVYWTNVPIAGGKSFYPTLTLTMDSGTPLKTKQRIWVEVTGNDMEATSTNFSVTAVAAKKATTLTSTDVTTMFQEVYGRAPAKSELTYWMGRRGDKPTKTSLQGAMGFHKAQGITH